MHSPLYIKYPGSHPTIVVFGFILFAIVPFKTVLLIGVLVGVIFVGEVVFVGVVVLVLLV